MNVWAGAMRNASYQVTTSLCARSNFLRTWKKPNLQMCITGFVHNPFYCLSQQPTLGSCPLSALEAVTKHYTTECFDIVSGIFHGVHRNEAETRTLLLVCNFDVHDSDCNCSDHARAKRLSTLRNIRVYYLHVANSHK